MTNNTTIKEQAFGVEIEMTGISRKNAARITAKFFGTEAIDLGTYYATWGATDSCGYINDSGIEAIEKYIVSEGYKLNQERKEEKIVTQSTNIWDQADLISLMKKDYDKAVAERDAAKAEAQENFELLKQYESEIDELEDKLLIAEKENNALKEEKIKLSKMQLKTVDFDKEIDSLQKRIAQYNAEINAVSAEVNEFRKDVSVLITGVSQLQEKKKKLEGVMSDLVGCSKRLMNMK